MSVKMAEPKAIIADPISSDGSEESWILLDEMDEAMNEEFNMSQVSSADQSDSIDQTISTETLTDENLIEEANIVEDANEITPSMVEEIINEPLTLATISSEALSLSNDEEDEDIDEDAHLRRLELNLIHLNKCHPCNPASKLNILLPVAINYGFFSTSLK